MSINYGDLDMADRIADEPEEWIEPAAPRVFRIRLDLTIGEIGSLQRALRFADDHSELDGVEMQHLRTMVSQALLDQNGS